MAKLVEGKNPSKPYTVRYWVNGKQREKSFAHRADAERFRVEVEPIEVSACETFREYATRWNDQTGQSKTKHTVRQHESALRLHIFPVLGDLPLNAITREMCKDLLLSSGLTPATASQVKRTLNAVFNEAVRDKRIADNPAYRVNVKYDSRRAELVTVTFAQLEMIEGELPADWRLALWLMYGCGLRIGEAFAVKASNIRENGTVLRVEEQVISWRRPGDSVIGPLKARKVGEHRDIPLPRWLLDKIEDHIARYRVEDYLFHEFVSGEMRYQNFQWRFEKAARKAGVPKLHPHALRHYFASTMLAGGCSMEDVSRWLGHRRIQLTYDTYSHFLPSSGVRAREASDRAMQQFMLAP